MGAGASAQSSIFGPPDGVADPEAEWRSENVRELDRLGGNQRPALKRGLSTRYRLEWLKEALHEQGDRLEEALAKDPLAGRHEILRQEAVKVARSLGGNQHRFTVREWQTMKHTDLRAQQAREEQELRLRERDSRSRSPEKDRPAWNALHWAHMSSSQEFTPSDKRLAAGYQSSEKTSQPGTPTGLQRPKIEDPFQIPFRESNAPAGAAPTSTALAVTFAATSEGPAPQDGWSVSRSLAPVRPLEPPAEWRVRIARAKRKAMMIISVVIAFRGRKHRARGLQRLDSLSYFIAQHLSDDLPKFAEEQLAFRSTKASAMELQTLAEQLWRDQNYNNSENTTNDANGTARLGLDGGNLVDAVPAPRPSPYAAAAGGPTPISPRPRTAMPSSPGGGANGNNSSNSAGHFRPPPAPVLRLPPGVTSGGSAAAAGRSGSPLLRSRPTSLTPTLHQSPLNVTVSAPVPSSGGLNSPSASGGGAPGASTMAGRTSPSQPNSTTSSHALIAGSSSNRSLPVLRSQNSARALVAPSGPLPPAPSTSSSSLLPADETLQGTTTAMVANTTSSSSFGGAATAGTASAATISSGLSMVMRYSAPGLHETSGGAVGGSGSGTTAALPQAISAEEGALSASLSGPLNPAGSTHGLSPLVAMALAASNGSSNSLLNANNSAKQQQRWSSPRFQRKPTDIPTPPLGTAPCVGAGGATARRATYGSLPRENDMATPVTRAQSWADPLVRHTQAAAAAAAAATMAGGPDPTVTSSSGTGGPAPPSVPYAMSARGPRRRYSSTALPAGGTPGTAMGPSAAATNRSSMATIDDGGDVAAYGPTLPPPPRSRPSTSAAPQKPSVARAFSAAPIANGSGSSRNSPVVRRTRRGIDSAGAGGGGGGERPSTVPAGHNRRDGRLLHQSSSVRRMLRDGRSDQLFLKYQEETAAMERPLRMMQLYANRANARWVEDLTGGTGPLLSTSGFGGSAYNGPAAAAAAKPTSSSSSAAPTQGGAAGPPAAAAGVQATATATSGGRGSGGNGGTLDNSGSGAFGAAANGAAGAPLGWDSPHVYDASRLGVAVGGAKAGVFRAEVTAAFRAGKVAVQLLAGDDHVVLSNGQSQPLWSADPWDLIGAVFPARAAAADRLRQVPMGPRLLMALVLAVEALAGAEAVSRLVVVLHLHDCQQEEVLRDLRYRRFCGLRPENLILIVQQRHHGYGWDAGQTVFVRDDASPLTSAGSGYAIMQLVWPEEAFQLELGPPTAATNDPNDNNGTGGTSMGGAGNGLGARTSGTNLNYHRQSQQANYYRRSSGSGAAFATGGYGAATSGGYNAAASGDNDVIRMVPLGVSVLEYLAGRGAEWLLTRRLRDISLYHPEMTLDADALAYGMYLYEHLGANMNVQVEMVDSVSNVRTTAHSGVVLAPCRVANAAAARRRSSSSVPLLGISGGGSVRQSANGVGGTGVVPDRASAAPTTMSSGGAGQVATGGAGSFVGGGLSRAASDAAVVMSSLDGIGAASSGAGGGGGVAGVSGWGLHPSMVVDIKNSDLATPRTTQLLNEIRARGKGRLAISTRRYLWRLDVLQALVQRSSVFHPSLEVAGEHAYLSFEMSDLTAATDCGARCVAIAARHPARTLVSLADIEELTAPISAQDSHAPFRRMASNVSVTFAPAERASGPAALAAAAAAAALAAASASASAQHSQTGAGGISESGQASSSNNPIVVPVGSFSDFRSRPPGQRIVVLVADNESTTLAVQLLMALVKPGRDVVVLVTVVNSTLQETAGRLLLRRHEATLARAMVDVMTEVLQKNTSGSLVDQLDAYCEAANANLIVMGSQMLASAAAMPSTNSSSFAAAYGLMTSGGGVSGGGVGASGAGGGGAGGFGSGLGGGASGGAILGSVAVSLLRTGTRPLLIVKANAKYAAIAHDRDKLRVLLEVTHNSRGMLRYVASKLASGQRHDKLFLTRGGVKSASHQDSVTSHRLLDNFSDIATQYQVQVVKRALEEPFETGAAKFADHDKAHIIAVQAPAGRGVPNSILNLIRVSRSAVLVYRGADQT